VDEVNDTDVARRVAGGCLTLVRGLLLGVSIVTLVEIAIFKSGADISYIGAAFWRVPLFWWGLYLLRRREPRKKQPPSN
jgi:hypothetical protein